MLRTVSPEPASARSLEGVQFPLDIRGDGKADHAGGEDFKSLGWPLAEGPAV
jgi:hypothetical protein